MTVWRPSKQRTMIEIAWVVSERSTCSRKQVGCVLTDTSYENIVIGYNGGPKGGPNHCLRDTPGNCGCLHAEVNAVAKSFRGEKYAFITLSPCEACAILLVNAGVTKVWYGEEYRAPEPGLNMLTDCNVEWQLLPS